MKVLKIFGIVVGIHVFALVLIFANPGCSSSTKPAPAPSETVVAPPPPSVGAPSAPSAPADSSSTMVFNPDAPAVAPTSASSPGVRFTPTRPGSPAATAVVAEPVADVTPATTYTVKSGDSLWTIARKHNLTIAQLTAANSLPSNVVLRAGQKLVIPGKPASPTAAATANPAAAQGKTAETVAPRPAPTANTSAGLKHTVKSGESLSTIAKLYGVKPGDIAVANNVVDPAKIKAGTELVIPGWDTPASKSAKSSASKSSSSTPAPKATPSQSTPPPAINVDPEPQQPAPPPQVPVIRIDEGPSPIVPAPKQP